MITGNVFTAIVWHNTRLANNNTITLGITQRKRKFFYYYNFTLLLLLLSLKCPTAENRRCTTVSSLQTFFLIFFFLPCARRRRFQFWGRHRSDVVVARSGRVPHLYAGPVRFDGLRYDIVSVPVVVRLIRVRETAEKCRPIPRARRSGTSLATWCCPVPSSTGRSSTAWPDSSKTSCLT